MSSVVEKVKATLPTKYGIFTMFVFVDPTDQKQKEHCALVRGPITKQMLIRIHSECLTGDVLASTRCDCGQQLHLALERISEQDHGMLLYLRQEGRGIGLTEKLKAYNLQDKGYDTVEANLQLGHQADLRNYDVAVAILKHFQVHSVEMLTNNPGKIKTLEEGGITVHRRLPLLPQHITQQLQSYLQTKADRLGHIIDNDLIHHT